MTLGLLQALHWVLESFAPSDHSPPLDYRAPPLDCRRPTSGLQEMTPPEWIPSGIPWGDTLGGKTGEGGRGKGMG